MNFLRIILLVSSILSCREVYGQDISSYFIGRKVDTIKGNDNRIYMLSSISKEDSLICIYNYYVDGQIENVKFDMFKTHYRILAVSRSISYYENGNKKSDSLSDDRILSNQQFRVAHYFENGQVRYYKDCKGEYVKAQGVFESFSWITIWTTEEREFDDYGHLIRSSYTKEEQPRKKRKKVRLPKWV